MANHSIVPADVPGFILTERLGCGSYATVYKAYRKSDKREVAAIKCILTKTLTNTAKDNLVREIAILKELQHEHIVQLKDFTYDKHYVYIVMEYCSGGDLSSFIRSKRCLPEATVKRFLQQLATALQFLRSRNICHMDLKPQNILLSSRDKPVLKVADFGFAHFMKGDVEAENLKGSPLYMAPEIICKRKYDAVDLWSLGVILYECLFGRAPFASRTFAELAEKIHADWPVEIPCGVAISDSCRDLLTRLLQRDPDRRISFQDFFAHSFIDLEHMPSVACLDNATVIVKQAVEQDEYGNLSAAVKLYCQAIEYFVPAIQFEQDHTKKEALRGRVRQYVTRAELLKNIIKPKTTSTNHDPYQELLVLATDNPKLVAALKLANGCQVLEENEQYDVALDKYQLALGVLLPIAAEENKGRRKDLLYQEVNRWMARAEEIKTYLAVHKCEAQAEQQAEESAGRDSLNTSCTVQ